MKVAHTDQLEKLVMATVVMLPPEKRVPLLQTVVLLRMGKLEGISPEAVARWQATGVLPSVRVMDALSVADPADMLRWLSMGGLDSPTKDLMLELLPASQLSAMVLSGIEGKRLPGWSVEFEPFFNDLPRLKPDATLERLRRFEPVAREVILQLMAAEAQSSLDVEAVMAPDKPTVVIFDRADHVHHFKYELMSANIPILEVDLLTEQGHEIFNAFWVKQGRVEPDWLQAARVEGNVSLPIVDAFGETLQIPDQVRAYAY